MNEAEAEQERIRRFEESNLCGDLLFLDKKCCVSQLFDSRWAKQIEACPDYVKVAASVWAMTSTNWQHNAQWQRFFNRHLKEVQRIWMDDHDLLVLGTFPNPFTLYRGYNKPLGKMGFSWTLEKRVAAKISSGRGINSWIITATANPEDVIAYSDRRLEREVIIDPKKIVKVLKDEPVSNCMGEEQTNENSTKTYSSGNKSTVPSFLNYLKCTRILKLPNRRATQINGMPFKAGEQKQVKIEGREVKIHCLEILEESVQIKIEGVKEVMELFLIASGKRWKSYSG